ncbi:GUN4 domain-containing protein [Leptolyngbya sp. PCC 6406]|uniref:GUN4 domain-containing protein n=1 Tax=Leptolyngbya sp. PCC 6406 TaxID=1173264 RepID=UPI0002ACC788|nr:GUN4 domain-containing protein [Leptolyngbya sp. PCC 6406]
MTQVYSAAPDTSARVVFQVIDPHLSTEDRDRETAGLLSYLQTLEMAPAANLIYLTDPANPAKKLGVQMTVTADRVRIVLQALSDHLRVRPLEVRLLLLLHQVRLQVQSRNGEELLALLPAVDTLLPARQIFQARAETYALRGGEHSPVEQANLELLRYRLNLPLEEAEAIIARSLGPYLDRQAKLQKYREVLNAELDRGDPLSDATWAELRQLYQSLGLSYDDVAGIDQEHITRIRAEVTRLEQTEKEAEEETRMLEMQEQSPAPTTEQNQETYIEQYRQEFQEAIAQNLYPSDFDRGRLEQARRFWHLEPERVQAIEQEVTAALYGPIDSAQNLDYTRLRQLLWSQQWQLADQETERLILTALSRDMCPIDGEAILHFPCVDMNTLDALWAHYSEGRFGFRAQYRIYAQQDRRADEFLQAVAWQGGIGIGNVNLVTRHKTYRDLQFQSDAPTGHLPSWRWGCKTLESEYVVPEALVDALFLHVEKCLPGAAMAPSGQSLTIAPPSPTEQP